MSIFNNHSKPPDVFIFTETWFEKTTVQNIPGYKAYHSIREGSRSGGVSIYIKAHIESHFHENLTFVNQTVVLCTVSIKILDFSLIILGIYRPHSDTIENFTLHLDQILNSPILRGKATMLTGDFNINILSDDSSTHHFSQSLYSQHFLPLINKPTRFDPANTFSPTLLDHIWYNKFNFSKCGIVLSDFTDHLPVYIDFPIKTDRSDEKVKITFRQNDQNCKDKFLEMLESYNWEQISSIDANTYTQNFSKKINEFYVKTFPKKTKLISKKYETNPWMNTNLRKLIDAKSVYFTLYREGIITKDENNAFKNKVTKIIDRTKIQYRKDLFNKCRNNIRTTWKHIKNIAFSSNKKTEITKLIVNNIEYSNPNEICEVLNDFFCNVGTEIDNSIPSTNYDPITHVTNNTNSMFLYPAIDTECSIIIQNLKNSKQDLDTLPVAILKEHSHILSPVIADLINVCFSTGVFPLLFKKATVISIFKKGDKTNPSNYRPISLLPLLSKILEKCFHTRLTHFIASNNLITHCQFGFQKGLSTEDAISEFCELVYSALNDKHHTINILVDLQKAYDTINREILLKKLDAYGVRGVPLDFIHSFLSDRTQRTKMNDTFSNYKIIPTGLPTGSVLSCTLFLLYINDMPQTFKNMYPIIYADDTTLSCHGTSMQTIARDCNEDLNSFYEWTKANRLSINTQKTHTFILSNRPYDQPQIYINNSPITSSTSAKFLGVTLDSNMKFNLHTKEIATKIASSAGVLYNLQNYLPTETLTTLYYTLVYPYINYCIMIWGGTCTSHIKQLETLQKRCIRTITGSTFLAHTSPLFKKLKILKIRDVYNLKLALRAYKNRSTLEAQYSRTHSHNTRHHSLLLPHFERLTTTQNSLHYRLPTLWNTIPIEIKNSQTITQFKRLYKDHLLNKY